VIFRLASQKTGKLRRLRCKYTTIICRRHGHSILGDAHPLISGKRETLELATLEWVAWFNHQRLHSAIGLIPPAV